MQAQRDEELNRLKKKLRETQDELHVSEERLRQQREQVATMTQQLEEMERNKKREELKEKPLNLEYLKNIVLKFAESGPTGSSEHEALLPVIFTVLEFSPEERQRVVDRRQSATSANTLFGSLSSFSPFTPSKRR
eukprot:GILI01017162.1.p2 GENE.GILI01017162.1~~GILI01017162.1.p2  ORF type:complete len:135 (+),score=52.69 GILI01017162.1:805-1209(+)